MLITYLPTRTTLTYAQSSPVSPTPWPPSALANQRQCCPEPPEHRGNARGVEATAAPPLLSQYVKKYNQDDGVLEITSECCSSFLHSQLPNATPIVSEKLSCLPRARDHHSTGRKDPGGAGLGQEGGSSGRLERGPGEGSVGSFLSISLLRSFPSSQGRELPLPIQTRGTRRGLGDQPPCLPPYPPSTPGGFSPNPGFVQGSGQFFYSSDALN